MPTLKMVPWPHMAELGCGSRPQWVCVVPMAQGTPWHWASLRRRPGASLSPVVRRGSSLGFLCHSLPRQFPVQARGAHPRGRPGSQAVL